MSASVSAAIGNFLLFKTIPIPLKFQFFPVLVCLRFCNIIMDGEPMHTAYRKKEIWVCQLAMKQHAL